MGICKSVVDGTNGSAAATIVVSCSGRINNSRLCVNHQLSFLFSSSVSRAGRLTISPASQIPVSNTEQPPKKEDQGSNHFRDEQ